MPKLWKLFGQSSKNNETSTSTPELKQIETKKTIALNDKESPNPKNNDLSASLIHNRVVLQEFIELQKGIVNEVIYVDNGVSKEVIMKVDLLGVHVYDADSRELIKEFEVEQIIQYSYERDQQYLTLSYMNSDYAVESYDFITPDYFEIFDFIGHVIAMVIKMNNQKYEAEEEKDSDELSFQLPSLSAMFKSSDSQNIFSPTFILNNFMPENNQGSSNYLNEKEDKFNSLCFFGNDYNKYSLMDDKDSSSFDIKGKSNTDRISRDLSNLSNEFSSSTPNLINGRLREKYKSAYAVTQRSEVDVITPLSDSYGFDKDSKKLDNEDNSNKNRVSTQFWSPRGMSGKFDTAEIPAYGKKYGTIHYRRSHDVDELYASEFLNNNNNNSNSNIISTDTNSQDISNQTQARVNIMKFFVENRYNLDRKTNSCGILLDKKDEIDKNLQTLNLDQHTKKEDSDEDDNMVTTIDSSMKDVTELVKEEEKEKEKEKDKGKKKHKSKLHLSKSNVAKAYDDLSPSIDTIDESESPTKKSNKLAKKKYTFARPKSLQLNFLTYGKEKDSSKKRISIKNPCDISDIYTPSSVDSETFSEKSSKRKSYLRKSKKKNEIGTSSLENMFEENEACKTDNEIGDSELEGKKNKKSNNIQYFNCIANENDGKSSNENINSAVSDVEKSKTYTPHKSKGGGKIFSAYSKEFLDSINCTLSPISHGNNSDSNLNVNSQKTPPLSATTAQSPSSLDDVSGDKSKNDNRTSFYKNPCKSEEIINLDLNIIKDQYKDTISKSSNCLEIEDEKTKVVPQNNGQQQIILVNEQQQLHKYKSKQIMNYRSIHGVSPFAAQTQSNSATLTSSQIERSMKTKSIHNDIYSTFRKFVSKNQKPKTPINEVNFTDGAPEGENKSLPQVEKEYENGQEYLIRTLKDNHYEVSAGTVHALINEMILNNTTDIMFIDIFLLTYRHFLKANDFILLLTEEFNKLLKKAEDETEKIEVDLQIQKIASVIKKWVAEYFNDFSQSTEALNNLNALIDIMKNSDKAQCQSYVDQITSLIKYGLKETDEDKEDEIEIPDKNQNLKYDVDLVDILGITSKKIAQQLTLVDSKIWRSIGSAEYAHFLWDGKDVKEKNTKNIQKFIERFNQISFWVSTMICKTQTLKTRAAIMEKMIKVAKYCLEIQNFNTTMAILSGLNMAAVSRLKGTWMCLSTKTMNTYTEIEEVMSYKSNFKNYRDLEYNAKPPLIPFFGLLLKDLTFMNDGNQKILKNELINFQKLRLIYTKIKSVNLLQTLYNFQPDNTIIESVKLSPTESNCENLAKQEIEMYEYFKILPHYTEMTLLELSRKIENSNAKQYNTIMVPKAQSKSSLNDNDKHMSSTLKTEKVNTPKNSNLVELFQQ